jgi:hypothetical protein
MAEEDAAVAARKARLELLHAEVDAALNSQSSRLQGMQTRAGTLVAASALLGTLQVTDRASVWVALNLLLAFVAGGLGLYATAPSRGRFLNVHDLQTELRRPVDPLDLLDRLIDEKVKVYDVRAGKLRRRATLVTVGFWIVAASLLVTLFSAFNAPAPTPATPTSAATDEGARL